MKNEYYPYSHEIKCSNCGKKIRYTWLSGMGGDVYFFYSYDGKKILVSEKISKEIDAVLKFNSGDSLEERINNLLKINGHMGFSIWNNVRCLSCGYEFPYRFKGNVKMRLGDSKAILVQGIQLIRDREEDSHIVGFK